MTPCILVNRY